MYTVLEKMPDSNQEERNERRNKVVKKLSKKINLDEKNKQ